MKQIISLAIVVLSCLYASSQDLSVDYLDRISTGDSLIKQSKWEEAERMYVEAMRMHPSNPTNVLLMSNVGMLRHYAGRDSSALSILNDAIKIAPKAVTVRENKAKVLTSLGRLDEAADEYDIILSQDSMVIGPRHMRCMLSLYMGDIQSASADAQFLKLHYPNEVETNEASGIINIITGKYQDAISNYSALIQKKPTAASYGERAYCYLMMDFLNEASADLTEAIRLDPQNGELYLYRAILNQKRYRPRDATEDVQKAISLGVDREQIEKMGIRMSAKQ